MRENDKDRDLDSRKRDFVDVLKMRDGKDFVKFFLRCILWPSDFYVLDDEGISDEEARDYLIPSNVTDEEYDRLFREELILTHEELDFSPSEEGAIIYFKRHVKPQDFFNSKNNFDPESHDPYWRDFWAD